jgi:peptidoglycan/xylan/chitin deacetylase (PgdA/CDA1 family)
MRKEWIIPLAGVVIVVLFLGILTVFGTGIIDYTTLFATGTLSTPLTTTPTELRDSPGGVALTFDDIFIDDWFAARDLFKKYDAHVTFFVSEFANRNESQINKLKQLQSDGHEIAFHGTQHRNAADYLKNHSVNEYINDEIIPGVNMMRKQGLNPVDFSYPYGVRNDSLTEPLKSYFLHTRGIHSGQIFYQQGSNTTHLFAGQIDDSPLIMTLNDIYDNISRAKQENKIVVFYAHQTVPSTSVFYHITYDRLEKILINVSENKMKFYTISELH